MLVQRRNSCLLIFTQHDHGLSCGEILRRWTAPGPPLSRRHLLELATSLHDIAWTEEDERPRFNATTGQPYDFMDLPIGAKAGFYANGIEVSERVHPYVGLLQSLHYAPFMPDEEAPAFRENERARQSRLRASLKHDGFDLSGVQDDLGVLRGIDVLSLHVSVAQPGALPASVPAWLPAKFSVWGTEYTLNWASECEVAVTPFPFAEPWQLSVPHRRLDVYRFESEEALIRSWEGSSNTPWSLRFVR